MPRKSIRRLIGNLLCLRVIRSKGKSCSLNQNVINATKLRESLFRSSARATKVSAQSFLKWLIRILAEFFAESIVNPNAVIDPQDKEMGFLGADGKSRMPTYSDVLTVKQLADLATYLHSLKRDKHSGHR